jgi:phosphoribosylglycinamide formyltransferase 1
MGKIKIAVLISGGGTNLQAIIDAIESGAVLGEIVLVISSTKEAFGLTRAEKHGIHSMVISREEYPDKQERERVLLETLEREEVDLIILAGYLAIVPDSIIIKYRNRIMNIHPSLIPSFCGKGYYGEKVHQEVYDRGVKITGATVHFVNEETDGGPIILQETVTLDFEDDPKSIQKKVLVVEHKILPQAVKLFAEGKLEVIDNRTKIKDEVKA